MRRATIIGLACGLAACTAVNDPGRHMGSPPPSGDAGGGVDAGGGLDGGPGDDGGGMTDAGGPRDGGGTTDAGTDAGPGPIEAIDLCDELVAMACEAKLRCCSTTMETMAQCRIALEPDCSSALETIAIDLRTGYDPTIAREVVEEGRAIAATCDPDILDWFSERDGLMRMFQGTAPADSRCTLGDAGSFWSCQFPMYCISNGILGRTCQRPAAETSNCFEDISCETGLFCRRPTLAVGVCVSRHGDGIDCMRNAQCDSLICGGGDMGMCQPRTADIYCAIRLGG